MSAVKMIRDSASRNHFLLLAAIFLASLVIRAAFPITAYGNAIHDDRLFVEMSSSLGNFHWLGPYNEFTLAKGAAYSVFLLLNRITGLPLKVTEHFAHLSVALFFALTVANVLRSRAGGTVCFLVLAMNPVVWNASMGGRVVREGFYMTLALLLIGLALRVYTMRRAPELREDYLAKKRYLIAFGLTGGVFWLTREEGLWIVPSLAVVVGFWVLRTWRELPSRRALRAGLPFLAVPLLSFAAVVGTVDAINYFVYGVFRNNDFRSADFQGAYGALSRIRHDNWQRYVVFPADARERAYSVSAAARELQPYFEGDGGLGWRRITCEQTGKSGACPEILSGWFMWALRGAVTQAGHYRSALESRAFYRRLAGEINAACDAERIPCGPERSTMIPPWQPSYVADTATASWSIFSTLVHLKGADPAILASTGNPGNINFFKRVTNGPIATETDMDPKGIRRQAAKVIAKVQQHITPVAVMLAFVAWVVLLLRRPREMWLHPGNVIALALTTAVATRVVLLGLLDATSIPSNNVLYVSPAVPMLLAFAPCVAAWILGLRNGSGASAVQPA